MQPQKAYHRFGIREQDITIEPWPDWLKSPATHWAVVIPNENRPNGKQILTSGSLGQCIWFKVGLRKEHDRVVAHATKSGSSDGG